MDGSGLTEHRFVLEASPGKDIIGTVRYPAGKEHLPAVIVLHGFKGFKDWGFFPYLCRNLAESGAVVVSFNFSLNGIREGSDIFEQPEDFAANTISREIMECGIVLHALQAGAIVDTALLSGSTALLGHSRGGGVAVLAAQRFGGVSKLVLWAAVSRFARYTERQKQEWRARGSMDVPNTRTGQVLRMDLAYLRDVEEHRHEPLRAIAALDIPILILHGAQDLTVKAVEARALAGQVPDNKAELHIIEKTGHTFGAVHPFAGSSAALDTALALSGNFLGL